MALTPTAAWKEACLRADPDFRFLVAITDGVSTWTFVDGAMDSGSDLAGIEVGVQDVSVVAVEVDPIRRKQVVSELFVNYNDEALRPIIVANRLQTRALTVHLGAASLDEADFLEFFSGSIDTITPVRGDDPKITLSVLDPISALTRRKITGYWIGDNPLEILYKGNGSGILEKVGTFSYDANSFDPSHALNAPLAHIMFSRTTSVGPPQGHNIYILGEHGFGPAYEAGMVANSGVDDPTPAIELASSLCEIIDGHLNIGEDGKVEFKRFVSGVASVDDWGDIDIVRGTLKQEPIGQNIINRVIVDFAYTGLDWAGDIIKTVMIDDTDSQGVYGVKEHHISTPWIDPAVGWLTAPIDDADVSLDLAGGNMHGLSGNRPDAWGQIDAGNPLYLLLQTGDDPTVNEIIKATSLTRDPAAFAVIEISIPSVPGTAALEHQIIFLGCQADVDNITRGMYGTDAVSHGGLHFASDITAIIMRAESLLARFAYGADAFTVDTNMSKYEIQLGDFITPTFASPGYVAYGEDGLDGTIKYEAIAKEVDIYADPPVIHWKFMSAAAVTPVMAAEGGSIGLAQAVIPQSGGVVAQSYVEAAGLLFLDGGGLSVNRTAGATTDGDRRMTFSAKAGISLTASKDYYVRTDYRTRTTVFTPVAPAAAAPYQHPYEQAVAEIVVGAAGITSIDNTVRNSQPIQGAKLVDNSVGVAVLNRRQAFGESLNLNPTGAMRTRG